METSKCDPTRNFYYSVLESLEQRVSNGEKITIKGVYDERYKKNQESLLYKLFQVKKGNRIEDKLAGNQNIVYTDEYLDVVITLMGSLYMSYFNLRDIKEIIFFKDQIYETFYENINKVVLKQRVKRMLTDEKSRSKRLSKIEDFSL